MPQWGKTRTQQHSDSSATRATTYHRRHHGRAHAAQGRLRRESRELCPWILILSLRACRNPLRSMHDAGGAGAFNSPLKGAVTRRPNETYSRRLPPRSARARKTERGGVLFFGIQRPATAPARRAQSEYTPICHARPLWRGHCLRSFDIHFDLRSKARSLRRAMDRRGFAAGARAFMRLAA